MPSRLWEDETNKREMPIGVGRGSGEQQKFVSQSTTTAVDAFPESDSSLVVEGGDGTTAMAVEIRWAITQPAMRSRWVLVSCGTRNIYALECCSVERSGADKERLMVWRRVASCIEFVRFGFNNNFDNAPSRQVSPRCQQEMILCVPLSSSPSVLHLP